MEKSHLLAPGQDIAVSINKRDSQTYRITAMDEESFEMIAHSFKDSNDVISIILRPLRMPSPETATIPPDPQKMWAEVVQTIVVNFLRMPDENKKAVLDKIAPAEDRINHFLKFLKDGYGRSVPDFAVQDYLKWHKDEKL